MAPNSANSGENKSGSIEPERKLRRKEANSTSSKKENEVVASNGISKLTK
jgi:hypothetical protein